ncbi:hypothetical protein NV381_04290 [Paenibacillus sp. N5-1-1-5]|uniref:Uncharacterized protein n=1 Tax=Paenibacillus radicis (ex Xue et al. 2023) TaxID=2972489 RepID=A0ABT1YEM8_9BACL|nr:hypothetical protein [Paenibacillus radicis (ex Xue et al. 2023)]
MQCRNRTPSHEPDTRDEYTLESDLILFITKNTQECAKKPSIIKVELRALLQPSIQDKMVKGLSQNGFWGSPLNFIVKFTFHHDVSANLAGHEAFEHEQRLLVHL